MIIKAITSLGKNLPTLTLTPASLVPNLSPRPPSAPATAPLSLQLVHEQRRTLEKNCIPIFDLSVGIGSAGSNGPRPTKKHGFFAWGTATGDREAAMRPQNNQQGASVNQ
ncbi:hypothetical protein GWI33_006958 [Rhynchophorus ferrugineus]|uniref:Uncharacterized protein n=1 Tax=Rhynchophorus ferrugineus TaxID=354439 RepID=A0A834MDE7_RHYFE|nr:hypothetical protein GWI33_006958 [Rhynchophorus ferrugineus]